MPRLFSNDEMAFLVGAGAWVSSRVSIGMLQPFV
jgi:hypothetical protein